MERRSFMQAILGALGMLAAAPVMPRPVKLYEAWMPSAGGADYVAFVHPSTEAQFRCITARGRWQDAHRAWRNDGRPPLTLAQIDEKYGWKPKFTGEFGRVESVRFISMERVA